MSVTRELIEQEQQSARTRDTQRGKSLTVNANLGAGRTGFSSTQPSPIALF